MKGQDIIAKIFGQTGRQKPSFRVRYEDANHDFVRRYRVKKEEVAGTLKVFLWF